MRTNGRRESCGTVSSRCCRARGYRLRTSRIGRHANTRTTEKVYRKELRPVLRRGAKAMDDLFIRAANEHPTLPPASNENQTER